ncbi:PemK family transcriptional regulator [Candidatus Pacearchaeota archaeon CG10_big_fil_rev_8_21_14_0_10_34_76]|nr:MAG: PemK family transcriptional regulator [Candidatus Pacearchaeota archaeon CG10_big_fil_rev_8_21_14_0_10_34_76]
MRDGIIKRGDIFWADLNPTKGHEQGNIRPVLVVQNDIANRYSPTIIVVPITSRQKTKTHITNVLITSNESGLKENSLILCNQIRTIDKSRIIKIVSSLDRETMKQVDLAIKRSLDLIY